MKFLGTAEITSLDAFNQACQVHNFAVGVAFTKVNINSTVPLKIIKKSKYWI